MRWVTRGFGERPRRRTAQRSWLQPGLQQQKSLRSFAATVIFRRRSELPQPMLTDPSNPHALKAHAAALLHTGRPAEARPLSEAMGRQNTHGDHENRCHGHGAIPTQSLLLPFSCGGITRCCHRPRHAGNRRLVASPPWRKIADRRTLRRYALCRARLLGMPLGHVFSIESDHGRSRACCLFASPMGWRAPIAPHRCSANPGSLTAASALPHLNK